MRAIFALSLIAAVFASSDRYWQSYYIFYKAPGCGVADVVGIETYDSFDYSSGTTCSDQVACATHMTGSYEVYCTNGHPVNLGVRIWDIWTGTCTANPFPFIDYYNNLATTTTEVDDIYSYPLGCRLSSYSAGSTTVYYDFADTGATGTRVWENGDCGRDNATCSAADCGSSGSSTPQYASAAGGNACSTGGGYFLEPLTGTYTAPATKDGLFVQDTSVYVYPCKSDYSCCVANGDNCCNPPGAFGLSDVQCCADNAAIQNNTFNLKILNACLCDAEGAERGTLDETTGVCTITEFPDLTATYTEDTAEEACDYAKVLAWCSVHALNGDYTEEALGDEEPDDYEFEADEETGFTLFPNSCQPGISASSSGVVTGAFGGNYGTLQLACTGILADILLDLPDFECDAECASGSTLAIAAVFALF